MEDKKRCKFDFSVFLAVIMLVLLIGGSFLGTVFGIVNNKQVAYAESIFSNNLLRTTDFTSFDFKLVYGSHGPVLEFGTLPAGMIGNAFSQGSYVLGDSTGLHFNLLEGTSFIKPYLTYSTVYAMPAGTYTLTIDVSTTKGWSLSVVSVGSDSQYFYETSGGIFSYTYTTSSNTTGIQFSVPSARSGGTYYGIYTVNKLKIESGSTFTGWSADDEYLLGYNYGYSQGVLDGRLSNEQKGYTLLDNLSYHFNNSSNVNNNLITSFNFLGSNYGVNSAVRNNVANANSFSLSYLFNNSSVSPSYDYVGLKYSNDSLYGDIMLIMPWSTNDKYPLQVCFEVVSTGELLYISSSDTRYWNTSSIVGYEYNSNDVVIGTVYNVIIKVHFDEVVNLYFLPTTPIGVQSSSAFVYAMAYPYDSTNFNIYSTLGGSASNSFDEGYYIGLVDGAENAELGNAQAVANARAQGYEQGRREALEDSNDYSFIGLLGAVFDAPIKSFQGLLNFNVLGVNMQSFVLALLSLSVIIIIIKIALGGK